MVNELENNEFLSAINNLLINQFNSLEQKIRSLVFFSKINCTVSP